MTLPSATSLSTAEYLTMNKSSFRMSTTWSLQQQHRPQLGRPWQSHTHMRTHMHAHVYAHTRACTHTCMHTHMYTHTHAHTRTHTHTCTHT